MARVTTNTNTSADALGTLLQLREAALQAALDALGEASKAVQRAETASEQAASALAAHAAQRPAAVAVGTSGLALRRHGAVRRAHAAEALQLRRTLESMKSALAACVADHAQHQRAVASASAARRVVEERLAGAARTRRQRDASRAAEATEDAWAALNRRPV